MLFDKPKEVPNHLYRMPLVHFYSPQRTNTKQGELRFGLEFEYEGAFMQVATRIPGAAWTTHADGSLRGESGEFVLSRPAIYSDVLKALTTLGEAIGDAPLECSERTSTHIHLDASFMTVKEFHQFTTLFYLLEEMIVRRSGGEMREGNLFCLRGKDATVVLRTLKEAFQNINFFNLFQIERYANLNFNSFHKFGSLEIRCHRGTTDMQDVTMYVEALREIYLVACKLDSAIGIIEDFSAMGGSNFLRSKLPAVYKYLTSPPDPSFDVGDIDLVMWNSMEYAQDIAYCIELTDKKDESILGTKKKKPLLRVR